MLSCNRLAGSTLLATFLALVALTGPAHAVADGTLPTSTTAVVGLYGAAHVGDDDIHWD